MATNAEDISVVLAEQAAARSASSLPAWLWHLKHLLGLDRAIVYTVLARVVQILGSAGTVLLILRFLSPVEQGYYYTLLSLVSLQTVFELGFSFVILQLAAHECAHLAIYPDGRIEGDPVAHARLASVLQKTVRWYLVAAILFCAALLPLGSYFFSRQASATTQVAWHEPWVSAVVATAVLFFLNPFASFLEGCGRIWQVGRMRLGQAILGAVLSWGALLAHHGLYSPGMVNFGYSVAGAFFLYRNRKLLIDLLQHRVHQQSVSWRQEVWPFQWKIAVSWIGAYLSLTVLTPLLFVGRGPAEAGQFGMSLSITAYLSTVTLAWMSTKATSFGQMVARGDLRASRRLFFRTIRPALGLLIVAAFICEFIVMLLHQRFPKLAERVVSPHLFALLLVACVSAFIVQSMGIYLRSSKREPFLVQSLIVAMLTLVLAGLLCKPWGVDGATFSYFLSTGVVGGALGCVIFSRSGAIARTDLLGSHTRDGKGIL